MERNRCTILLITTRRWHSCARLAMAFCEAGFEVDVLCPKDHSVQSTSAARRVWHHRTFKPLASLTQAIAQSAPDLIVPCDDAAATHLHQLSRITESAHLKHLIASSLGAASSYTISASRTALHELAYELGVPVPRASMIASATQLETAIAAVGLPAFMKTDGSSGGTGVKRIETMAQARRAWHRLSSPQSLLRAFKRAVVDRDYSLLPSALARKRSELSLQQAIEGCEANSTIFCWRGEVLATITMQVVAASMQRGPSTVVRHIDHPEIAQATSAIAKHLHLSGMFGFDFILEASTGSAMLIEMNARPTQTSHLALGGRHDLAAAAYAAVTGEPIAPRLPVTTRSLIALFPGEWQRDPESPYLDSAFHDVPSSEPELIRLCLSRPALWKRWLTLHRWKKVHTLLRATATGARTGVRSGAWDAKNDSGPTFSAAPASSQIKQLP